MVNQSATFIPAVFLMHLRDPGPFCGMDKTNLEKWIKLYERVSNSYRLAFFEQKGRLVSPAKLLKDIRAHYALQVVQQCYVLILGMDVLGNPYTVIRDFTKGCGDFFYQPSLGSVQSPEEFAEGLSRGAHSLMGHVIGNPAAAVAQITGSLGQAVLSFDDHYQNVRIFSTGP
ncbi:hypothetical protein HPB51_015592 [Rhipicephalus microplus]|uniref:Uncharacterized protein n=1 Tax=Rhipicephalus microplus TaxID=6941 RepID=A0A9J6DGS7_RHIMP|nr:hypothetical protein HPB51_015592 [Rhipicephalus microplus]